MAWFAKEKKVEEKPKEEPKFAGYISSINLYGKLYKLKCEVTEVHPMTCPKCGSPLELHYGEGKCDYCGTSYTTKFELVEA